jgi:hypothetical protein
MARMIEGDFKFPSGDAPFNMAIKFRAVLSSAASGVISGLESRIPVDTNGHYASSIEEGVYDISYTMDGLSYEELGASVAVVNGGAIDVLSLVGAAEVSANPEYVDNFQALIGSFQAVITAVETMQSRQQTAYTAENFSALSSESPEDRLHAILRMFGSLAGVTTTTTALDLATDTELAQAEADISAEVGSFSEFKETFNAIFSEGSIQN